MHEQLLADLEQADLVGQPGDVVIDFFQRRHIERKDEPAAGARSARFAGTPRSRLRFAGLIDGTRGHRAARLPDSGGLRIAERLPDGLDRPVCRYFRHYSIRALL